jgi:hypothetical protein
VTGLRWLRISNVNEGFIKKRNSLPAEVISGLAVKKGSAPWHWLLKLKCGF